MDTKAQVLIGLYTLAFIVLGIVVMAASFGWWPVMDQVNQLLAQTTGKWISGLIGAIIVLIALLLFFSSFKAAPKTEGGVTQELSLGRVTTTNTAIDSVVRKAVRQVRGVREVRPAIEIREGGLYISLSVILTPDVKVPEVTAQIQENVKQMVSEIIGVNVLEIPVRVDNIGFDPNARVE